MTTKRRWVRTGALLLGAMWCAWLLPPLYQGFMRLCPTRQTAIGETQAVPAYARKLKMRCSECHIAFPKLNAFGRQFKINGYVKERGSSEGAVVVPNIDESTPATWYEKPFPWGGLVKSRPWENSSNATSRMQPLHELELFIAGGNAARKFSYFTEIEMESENQELEVEVTHDGACVGVTDCEEEVEVEGTRPFTPAISELQLGYHHNKYLNLLVAHRSFFMMDPYQTITYMGKQTAARRMMPMVGGASGVGLGAEMQTIALYGQVGKEDLGSVYYAIGLEADAGDPQGKGPKDLAARIAFEIPQGLMIGAFGVRGSQGWQTTPAGGQESNARPVFDYNRVGVDALFEMDSLFVQGAYTWLWDNNRTQPLTQPAVTRTTNRAGYLEAGYAFSPDSQDYAMVEPLVRYDYWTTGNQGRKYSAITAHLAHFVRENAKVFVEYTTLMTRPTQLAGALADKTSTWRLQAEIGF